LSGPIAPAAACSSVMGINPEWQNIIDQLACPSFICNDRSEVLAWNQAANEIIADFSSLSDQDRVMIRLLFVDPELRRRMLNWEEYALYAVAVFWSYYDKHAGDPWFGETVERLCEESTEFEAMWGLHNIQLKKISRVLLHIPRKGRYAPWPGHHLTAYPHDTPGLLQGV
jgi:hypothetical protein